MKNQIWASIGDSFKKGKFFLPKKITSSEPFWNKPIKGVGLWTSSEVDENLPDHKFLSDWGFWCAAEEFGFYKKYYRLIPKENSKVYEVSSIKELKEISKYKTKYSEFKIDYDLVKNQGYDGIHFSDMMVRFSYDIDIKLAEKRLVSLIGFDVESTFWFNVDWIKKVERVYMGH